MNPEQQSAPSPPPLPPAFAPAYPVRPAAMLLLAGLCLIGIVAFLEIQARQAQAWGGLLLATDQEPPWQDAYTLRARRLPLENFAQQAEIYQAAQEKLAADDLKAFGFDNTEWFIALDIPPGDLEEILDSGRIPTPGQPEVLAGIHTRLESFEIDDVPYHVVGKIQRAVPGLNFAYLLPSHEDTQAPFAFDTGATSGWLDPEATDRIRELDDPEAFVTSADLQRALSPTSPVFSYAVIFGLFMVAVGGAVLHLGVFQRFATVESGQLTRASSAIVQNPRVTFIMHIIMYGAFFTMMIASTQSPIATMQVQHYLTHLLNQGDLSYVGQAYTSGSIPLAALATFFNNFVIQTFTLTILASLVIPLIGLLKTLASFMLAGFGMAPIWSGMAIAYVPHAITMTLELEAYIVACIGVTLFWRDILRSLKAGSPPSHLLQSLITLINFVLLTGLMLALAGLYEAVTLILLR